MIDSLPPYAGLEIGVLAGLFRDTTNSYKFLLFRSLLDCLIANPEGQRISYADLEAGMPAQSWFLIRRYRLSFGKQDRTESILAELDIDAQAAGQPASEIKRLIARNPALTRIVADARLMRFVPTRLIKPWFEQLPDVRNKPEHARDAAVERLSRSRFEDDRPLYRIDGGRRVARSVSLHPLWVEYIRANRGILEGWLNHKWLAYLQRRNPNVPMLSEKLWHRDERTSLAAQRKFWKPAVAAGMRCIYTGEPLAAGSFALDHFIPHLWVAHDQLWNLIPTTREINSSKGAGLPPERLVADLAQAHHKALVVGARQFRNWEEKVTDYMSALNLDAEGLLDERALHTAYARTVRPQLAIARQLGFKPFQRGSIAR